MKRFHVEEVSINYNSSFQTVSNNLFIKNINYPSFNIMKTFLTYYNHKTVVKIKYYMCNELRTKMLFIRNSLEKLVIFEVI